MAPLVLCPRVYPQADLAPDCNWRQPHRYRTPALPVFKRNIESTVPANEKQWLPNQLQAVLNAMVQVADHFPAANGQTRLSGCQALVDTARSQRQSLAREVEKYCSERDAAASIAPE